MEDRAMRNTTLPTMTDPAGQPVLHPLTGAPITAIAWKKNGQPIWPVMGGSSAIPSGGQPPVAPPAPGTPPAPNSTPPANPGATPEPPDEQLGEGGKRALEAERRFHAEAVARAEAAEKERDELKSATQTDHEKAVEAARAEGRAESNTRLVRAEVKAAAAAAGFHDPGDAAVQLYDRLAEVKVTKDGDVDQAKVTEIVAELAQKKAYLLKVAGATPPTPLPGQGNHQPAPKSGREAGRAEAARRFGTKST